MHITFDHVDVIMHKSVYKAALNFTMVLCNSEHIIARLKPSLAGKVMYTVTATPDITLYCLVALLLEQNLMGIY